MLTLVCVCVFCVQATSFSNIYGYGWTVPCVASNGGAVSIWGTDSAWVSEPLLVAALTRAKRECFQRAEILQEQRENQQTMSQELIAECRLLLTRAEMEQYQLVHNRLMKEVRKIAAMKCCLVWAACLTQRVIFTSRKCNKKHRC